MIMADTITIEITEDGTIKVLTDGVSAANHRNAEDFLALLSKMAGGKTDIKKRGHGHTHTHEHEHEHVTHKH